MGEQNKTCEFCYYYELSITNKELKCCHRYPTTVPKRPFDFCGEFYAKDTNEKTLNNG